MAYIKVLEQTYLQMCKGNQDSFLSNTNKKTLKYEIYLL